MKTKSASAKDRSAGSAGSGVGRAAHVSAAHVSAAHVKSVGSLPSGKTKTPGARSPAPPAPVARTGKPSPPATPVAPTKPAKKPTGAAGDNGKAETHARSAKPARAEATRPAKPAASVRAAAKPPARHAPAPKPLPEADVLVLGEHPAAYLAAALIRADSKIRVLHSTIPGDETPDRLVILNPAFFTLHPLLTPLQRKLETTAVYGIQFLSDDPATRSEHRSKSALAYVGSYKTVRDAVAARAAEAGVELVSPQQLQIHRLDEGGMDVTIDGSHVRPKVMTLAGLLSESQQKLLGLPDSWGAEIVHRYSYLKLNGASWADLGSRPVVPMSLNLKETFCWGWLLPGPKGVQLAVAQPREALSRVSPADLLSHWAQVLRTAGILKDQPLPLDAIQSIDLPLAGALAHEGVANRTLLVGPAGGFYSACTEDIYPNCWSALFAADSIRKALKERHLQDALQPYRSKWRTTLGEYLRGPQQNFRFLLPFIYRNQVMTTRLTESILLGKSVVR